MIKGKDLILSIDGTPVAAAKSCSIEVSRNNIAVASPIDGMWKHFIPECIEWSASVECLCKSGESSNALIEAMVNGTEVTVRFYDVANNINKTGKALITSVSYQCAVGSLVRVGVSFQGSGAFDDYWRDITSSLLLYRNRSGKYYRFDAPTLDLTVESGTYYDVYSIPRNIVSEGMKVKIEVNGAKWVMVDVGFGTSGYIEDEESIPLSAMGDGSAFAQNSDYKFAFAKDTTYGLLASYYPDSNHSKPFKVYVNG